MLKHMVNTAYCVTFTQIKMPTPPMFHTFIQKKYYKTICKTPPSALPSTLITIVDISKHLPNTQT